MKPFYVLVHTSAILRTKLNKVIPKDVVTELERITREEDFFIVEGDPRLIPQNLPTGREIRVCGGLRELCVTFQFKHLEGNGYNANIYDPATFSISNIRSHYLKPTSQ